MFYELKIIKNLEAKLKISRGMIYKVTNKKKTKF